MLRRRGLEIGTGYRLPETRSRSLNGKFGESNANFRTKLSRFSYRIWRDEPDTQEVRVPSPSGDCVVGKHEPNLRGSSRAVLKLARDPLADFN